MEYKSSYVAWWDAPGQGGETAEPCVVRYNGSTGKLEVVLPDGRVLAALGDPKLYPRLRRLDCLEHVR